MNPVPKPPRSTPASRKAERQAREHNSLKVYAEKKPPKTLGRGKPGVKRFGRKRKVDGHTIKGLNQRTGLKAGTRLKVVGKRGKRLAPSDRKQEALSHALLCICGCLDHREPEKGEVSRAHLESRRHEKTRNKDWNNVPACMWLNHWLDHEFGGVECKKVLLILAKGVNRRLTSDEVRPLLKMHGYYDWRLTVWRV